MNRWADDLSPEAADTNKVLDESAPQLYSQSAINSFSFFGTFLFGAFLLAANARTLGRKVNLLPMFGFTAIYVSIFALLVSLSFGAKFQSGVWIGYFFTGFAILNFYFWPKYIGRETKYRARTMLFPTLILAVSYIVAGAVIIPNISATNSDSTFITFSEPEGKLYFDPSNISAHDARYMRDRLHEMHLLGPNKVPIIYLRRIAATYELVIPVMPDDWSNPSVLSPYRNIHQYLEGFAPLGPIVLKLTYPDTSTIQLTIPSKAASIAQ